MALYFARHGETDWNLERRLQSRRDVPLNARGLAQAREVKQLLQTHAVFAACYCSPLERARNTAAIIVAELPVEIVVEPALIEIDVGEYEGFLESELRARSDIAYDAWCGERFRAAAPGGESLRQAGARARTILQRAAGEALQHDVLIVAHQGINMAMKAELSGLDDDASLDSYKQANDEVDVWCMHNNHCLERLRADVAIDSGS